MYKYNKKKLLEKQRAGHTSNNLPLENIEIT